MGNYLNSEVGMRNVERKRDRNMEVLNPEVEMWKTKSEFRCQELKQSVECIEVRRQRELRVEGGKIRQLV